MRFRSSLLLLLLVAPLLATSQQCVRLEPPPWPEWVLRHWVWENEGDQASALALVDDYLARDIPVGAVIIDRPWEVEPTSFQPDPARYPDLGGLIDDFHARDVRVFLWAVSLINKNASSFAEAKARGFLLNDGFLIDWWAGRGAYLDYTNPEAVAWWHGLMDGMLDLGIDGWKVDGTDPYLLLIPGEGAAGPISRDEYRDLFYRDFFEYTRERLGPDRVITARPSDNLFGGPDAFPFAPPDVNFAGWVGDQDGSFEGLGAALSNMRSSSELGYVNFGSDIGGFRGGGLRDRELLLRWAQLGALSPIMENGGGGEHRPWLYDAEVLEVYRKFVKLHHELIPYLYSQGAESWQENRPLMRFRDGEFDYLLGDSLFVAPILREGGALEVTFPPGRWLEWLDESVVYAGSSTRSLAFPLDRYPVFVREGAIFPLAVVDAATAHGGPFSEGHLTVAVYPLPGSEAFHLYEEGGSGVRFAYRQLRHRLSVRSTATHRPLLWRIRGRAEIRQVSALLGADPVWVASTEALGSAPRTWTRDADGVVWVRIANPQRGVRLFLW